MNQKGQLTVGMGILITSICTTFAVATSYYTTLNTQDAKASTVKEELTKNASDVKEELVSQIAAEKIANAVQDTKIENLSKDITEIKTDVKSLLKFVGVKSSVN